MNFEQLAPDANKFLKEIARELGDQGDNTFAYRVMKSVLHTVRDILTPAESLHMISQLPTMIKAVYVDGWHLSEKGRIRSMKEFLECLRQKSDRTAARDFGNDDMARHHTKCVLSVLKRHVSEGELRHVMDQFPEELTELWLAGDPVNH